MLEFPLKLIFRWHLSHYEWAHVIWIDWVRAAEQTVAGCNM